MTVGKFRPTVPLSLKPSRDRRAPYKFTASGTLTNAGACSGSVTITAKAGKRTVSSRRAKVNEQVPLLGGGELQVARAVEPQVHRPLRGQHEHRGAHVVE